MTEDRAFIPKDVESRIRRAREQAVQSGCTPTEVWLGPIEQQLMDAIFQRSPAISVQDQADVMMNGLQDGAKQWEGLTIRFMTAPGVRVGVSFEDSHGSRDSLYDSLT